MRPLCALLLAGTITVSEPGLASNSQTTVPYNSLHFVPNVGQWPDSVLFRSESRGATLWLTQTGLLYQLSTTVEKMPAYTPASEGLSQSRRGLELEYCTVTARLDNCSPSAHVAGESLLGSTTNYFLGGEPSGWHTDIPNFAAVRYQEVYPGIDLKFYGADGSTEYDFIVSPGADYMKIQLSFEGADSLTISANGDLLIHTRWGNLIHKAPIIFQESGAARHPVNGAFRLTGRFSYGFSLSNDYNPALPLVIDPVLDYSTYLGGGDNEYANAIAVDAGKNVYVTGVTGSANFPIQSQYQTFQGVADVFVTKFDSTGSAVIYSTYIGGTHEYDEATAITLDNLGNTYLTGYTYSNNFPTVGPYQTFQGLASKSDAFVLKLSAAGNSLLYSTYLGGTNDDVARGIKIDGSGNAYVAGSTLSTNFPILGQYQSDQASDDAFVTKFNSTGNVLVFSTYVGGDSSDFATGLALDGSSNVYVVGFTSSTTFPTKTPFQTRQGSVDAFLAKLNAAGNTLGYSTYLGGTSSDYAQGVVIDGSSAIVTGFTRSSGFPTLNPLQTFQGGASKSDGFLLKMNAAGSTLVYGTFLGGSDNDIANAVALDGPGHVCVAGYTMSGDFPTRDAVQSYQGAATKNDAFAVKIKASGDSLLFGTYLGGSNDDFGAAIAADATGSLYVAGFTLSSNFLTQGQYQSDQPNDDVFVVKIGFQTGCCVGLTGNVDGDPLEGVDISDLSALIDFLYISFTPPTCLAEANTDGDLAGGVDISDLSTLIDFLYISFTPPAACL